MTSKVQLDRDVISGIWKHNLTPRLINSSDDDDENSDDTDGSKGRFDVDVSSFKLGVRLVLFSNYLKILVGQQEMLIGVENGLRCGM